jgi:hypothetical protein
MTFQAMSKQALSLIPNTVQINASPSKALQNLVGSSQFTMNMRRRNLRQTLVPGLKMYGKKAFSLLLLCLCVQLRDSVAEGDGDNEWIDSEWMGLVKPLLAAFFVTVGLHMLLYSHTATRSLLKAYMQKAIVTTGDVLSCEEINPDLFDIAVLYKAPVSKYDGSRSAHNNRQQFRYPDQLVEKRFLRRFQLEYPLHRGTVVRILRFPGRPKSGMLQEVVQDKLAQHSNCRTVLILVPGLLLWTLIVWLAVQTIQASMEDRQEDIACAVLVLSLAVFVLGSRMVSDSRFQSDRTKRYESAVPMVTKPEETLGSGKTEALLNQYPYNQNDMTEPVLPVVQGTDVVYADAKLPSSPQNKLS